METVRFSLNGDFIELYKLLKITQLASSGGEAKLLIEQEQVMLNNQVETRKRAKVKPGDIVQAQGFQLHVEP